MPSAKHFPLLVSIALVLTPLLPGCSQEPTNPSEVAPSKLAGLAVAAKPIGPADPTSIWKFPLDDSGLSVKSDRKYSYGTVSVYADGVCGVTGELFATTARSNSGDLTLNTGSDRRCANSPRKLTIVFSDGFTEITGAFLNLQAIENSFAWIPIGATVPRFLAIHGSPRCDRLQFGKDAKSDSVLVTRIDARTWRATSQVTPNDRAYCVDNALAYHMQVDFVVVASRDLP